MSGRKHRCSHTAYQDPFTSERCQSGPCSITHLCLHHTLQFSLQANLPRNLRSEAVLQSRAQPQPGSCPGTSAPPAQHGRPSSPGVGTLLLDGSRWEANKCSSRTPALHVAAASFPCYEMNRAFIRQTVTIKKKKKSVIVNYIRFSLHSRNEAKAKALLNMEPIITLSATQRKHNHQGKNPHIYSSKATSKSVDSFL